jgi:hypothetical protein
LVIVATAVSRSSIPKPQSGPAISRSGSIGIRLNFALRGERRVCTGFSVGSVFSQCFQ